LKANVTSQAIIYLRNSAMDCSKNSENINVLCILSSLPDYSQRTRFLRTFCSDF